MTDKQLAQQLIAKRILTASCTPANDLWTYVQKKRIPREVAEKVWAERHPGETLIQGVRWENDYMRDNDI